MKNITINITPEIKGKPSFSHTSARSPHTPAERSSFTPSPNLNEWAIVFQSPHAPDERSQRQDSAKASRRQQLQEAIAEQCLTNCLKNLGFLGEKAQLSCLNLAHQSHRGCRA